MERLPSSDPVYSLATRKALRNIIVVPVLVVFVVMILHHKGFFNIESFGIPENYLYAGGLGLILLALVAALLIWRCPGCKAHLGKQPNPTSCPSCGAQFK